MVPRKTFLFFLLDTPTGRAYYRNAAGIVLTSPITSGTMDLSLQDSPGNWLDTQLSFVRNSTYHGLNRSFSTPIDFVGDGAYIIKNLITSTVGTEVRLTLAVFKYNSNPQAGDPEYKLYYKGNLDLSKVDVTVLETVTVNLQEGGIGQLLKSYENTVLEIPCDGSIPENIKVNTDGLLVEDTFYYQITPSKGFTPVAHWLGASFINNEGDNYGIVRGTPVGSEVPNDLLILSSSEYDIYSIETIRVKLKGSIIVGNRDLNDNDPNTAITVKFQLYYRTQNPGSNVILIPLTEITQDTRFDFEAEIVLQPYEKLFLVYQMTSVDASDSHEIIAGNFSLNFKSKFRSTRTWGVSGLDLFKLMIAEICRQSSTTGQVFNYQATSQLLTDFLNFSFASGDAIRASGDPTYQRYYYSNDVGQTSFGPVIKKTLKELFEDLSVPLCAALGIGHNGSGETVFIERFEDVFDSSTVSFNVGEVNNLKWRFAQEYLFSDIAIGYAPQTYDQKAGKYEYNTTLEMKAPVISFEKKIEKISKTRWDSYGIEKLRSNIGASPTSTTRNDSDNSLFGLNTDRSVFIYDYFAAHYRSVITDPFNPVNTNVNLQPGVPYQKMVQLYQEGEYFDSNIDTAIFVFSLPGYAATEVCNININGIVNEVNKPPGTPPDSITFKVVHNGVVIFTQTIIVTGVNTPISINQNFTEAFAFESVIWIAMSTTISAEANINTATLTIGSYVNMSGVNIPVLPGTFQKLLSLPNVLPTSQPYTVGVSKVQYGFQYFTFNSLVPNTGFKFDLNIQGSVRGSVQPFIAEVFYNGVVTTAITVPGSVALNTFNSNAPSFSRNYQLGDIVFFVVSSTNINLFVSLSSSDVTFTSDYIKAYNLKRVQYDSLSGIPNIATNAAGIVRSDIAGAPYNIEDVTPKTAYKRWKKYWRSCFMDQVTGNMIFQTLSKNKYLSRSLNGVTITEDSDETILDAQRIFYPIEIEFSVKVNSMFAELLSAAINAHVQLTFMGNDIYGFPLEVSQKPALNETQQWKLLLSPKTDLNIFANITSFKQPEMAPTSIFVSQSSAVQFVPFKRVLDPKYHTYNRNSFLFSEQLQRWFQKGGYHQPVQIGDPITLQFFTREIDPIFYTVYKSDGTVYAGPQNLNTISSPAVINPYILWQYDIDTTGWDAGCHYIVISSTTVGDLLISECLSVEQNWEDTVLFEFRNSFNTQAMVFDGVTPFTGVMRVRGGYDNLFRQKYTGRFYTNQPADLSVLNAITYEVTDLFIFGDEGVPDYVTKKIMRALLMDETKVDGEGFSLNEGAEWETVFTKGAPKKLQKIEIRPSRNVDGISVTAAGIDLDNSLIVSVNPQSFGPNVTNASGTTDTDLIEITINN